jgi:hypothetical protein
VPISDIGCPPGAGEGADAARARAAAKSATDGYLCPGSFCKQRRITASTSGERSPRRLRGEGGVSATTAAHTSVKLAPVKGVLPMSMR